MRTPSFMAAILSHIFPCFFCQKHTRTADAIIARLDAIEQKLSSLNGMSEVSRENEDLRRQMHRVSQELNRTRQMYGWVLTGSRDDNNITPDHEPGHLDPATM